jgi:hypothetical protein
VQALERKHPGLPLAPGKVERREFEYKRHGTRAFILSRDVVTGKLVAPHAGPARTEEDFLAHVQAVVATDPQATRWHFICDNLLPGGAEPRTAEGLDRLHVILHQAPGSLHHTGEHPYAVHEESTVGGMVDLRLHTRRIQPQLASFRYLCPRDAQRACTL